MHNARTLITTILLTISLAGTSVAYADTDPVTVHAETGRSRDLVEWALDRYEQAGLAVPSADVYFHSSYNGCRGYDGLRTTVDGKTRIDICVLAQASRERTIVHEFAHAWIGEHLTTRDRGTFLAGRGLQTWNDPDTPWTERGTEHAAEIVRWGLQERCHTPGRIGDDEPANLAAIFESLTGTQPLCDPDSDTAATAEPAGRRGGPQA